MTETLVILIPASAHLPLKWWTLDDHGTVIWQGHVTPDQQFNPTEGDATIVLVPGDAIAIHWLALPTATPAQAAAAARHLLATAIAAPIDDQHVAAAPRADADGRWPVAVVSVATMRGWLDRLATHGLDPDALLPLPLLLTPPETGLVALPLGDQVALRGHDIAVQLEEPLVGQLFSDLPVHRLDGEPMRHLSDHLTWHDRLNLRQGMFARRAAAIPPRRWRRLAIGIALVVLAALAAPVIELIRLQLVSDRLEADILTQATRVLPANTAIDNPLKQMRDQRRIASGQDRLSTMAAALFTALQADSARLEALTYDNGVLRATLSIGIDASLDGLRTSLLAAGYRLTEGDNRVTPAGQRIDIEVTAQ